MSYENFRLKSVTEKPMTRLVFRADSGNEYIINNEQTNTIIRRNLCEGTSKRFDQETFGDTTIAVQSTRMGTQIQQDLKDFGFSFNDKVSCDAGSLLDDTVNESVAGIVGLAPAKGKLRAEALNRFGMQGSNMVYNNLKNDGKPLVCFDDFDRCRVDTMREGFQKAPLVRVCSEDTKDYCNAEIGKRQFPAVKICDKCGHCSTHVLSFAIPPEFNSNPFDGLSYKTLGDIAYMDINYNVDNGDGGPPGHVVYKLFDEATKLTTLEE